MKTRKLFYRVLTIVILSAALLPGPALAGALAKGPAAPTGPVMAPHHSLNSAAAPAPDRARVSAALRSAPLMFIENVGQFDERARFQVRGSDRTLWLAEDAIWVTVAQAVNLRLSFVGANPHPRLEPFNRLDTRLSYFIGDDPAKWHTDVPAWGGVRYVDLYPGIDLEATSENGRWIWRLVCVADCRFALQDVRLRVDGADALALDGDVLRLTTALGEYTLPLLQVVSAAETNVASPTITGDQVALPFASAILNPKLVLSPVEVSEIANPQSGASDLLYSTFLGGSGNDWGNDIAVDGAGSAYVTGSTESSDFPTTAGAFDTSHNGGQDAFVVKVNAAGTGLAYATFLGGSSEDRGRGITVDGAGSAYVTGWTWSSDFPTMAGAFDTSHNGGRDAFVVKVNAGGMGLAYATFLGGSVLDWGNAIAVDGAGSAYMTGETYSTDFPTTAGAFDTSHNGTDTFGGDAFVVKVNAGGTGLAYATFLGGSSGDYGDAIAVDGAGSAYVTGGTVSTDFPTTAGAFDITRDGGRDAFVLKVNAGGTGLVYATFLGGSDRDWGLAIAVDGAGSAYVTGGTYSSDFPTTAGAFDTSYNGAGVYYGGDAFVVKVNVGGTGLAYATFLGGSGGDGGGDIVGGGAIAVDGAGSAYVTGDTESSDFPTTAGAFDISHNGGTDAFVAKVNAGGTGLAYATFLGGSNNECFWGRCAIAVDRAGSAYVTGDTWSSDFPTTAGAFDRSCGTDGNCNYASSDVFVVKLAFPTVGTVTPGGGSLASSADRTTYTFAAGTFTDTVMITHTPPSL